MLKILFRFRLIYNLYSYYFLYIIILINAFDFSFNYKKHNLIVGVHFKKFMKKSDNMYPSWGCRGTCWNNYYRIRRYLVPLKRPSLCQNRRRLDKGNFYFKQIYTWKNWEKILSQSILKKNVMSILKIIHMLI